MKAYTVGVVIHVSVIAKDAADALSTAEATLTRAADNLPETFPDGTSVQNMNFIATELLS